MHVLESQRIARRERDAGRAESIRPGGDWTTLTGSPSGSDEALFTDATAEQTSGRAETVTLRQRASGGWFTAADLGASPSGLPPRPVLERRPAVFGHLADAGLAPVADARRERRQQPRLLIEVEGHAARTPDR